MKFGHSIDDSREKYPEITDDVLENLQAWAKAQDLPKIPEEQLALFFYSCYFNLEDTKRCMDVYYRMRTTIPEFFKNRDPRLKELQHSLKTLEFTMLPKSDPCGNRILFHRLSDTRPQQYMFNDGIKMFLMTIDADLYSEGCSPGYVFFFDMQGVRIGHLRRLSISSISKFFEYLQEGMPIRLKAIHIINAVWFIDKFLALIKPFMKREIYKMIHIHTGDISDIYPYIPSECLPKDLGGELDCVAKLHEAHSEKLDQLRDYFQEEESLFRNYIGLTQQTKANNRNINQSRTTECESSS